MLKSGVTRKHRRIKNSAKIATPDCDAVSWYRAHEGLKWIYRVMGDDGDHNSNSDDDDDDPTNSLPGQRSR
uniref:Uncharacterized protein n=1 Tax=Ciona intestinalis TaxID=7719 RepID=H2XZD4_CIOIN